MSLHMPSDTQDGETRDLKMIMMMMTSGNSNYYSWILSKFVFFVKIIRVQEKEHIILTPFERNIDFWRQLWRVIERRFVSIVSSCYS